MCGQDAALTYGTLGVNTTLQEKEAPSVSGVSDKSYDFMGHFEGPEGRAQMWKLIGLLCAFFLAYVNVSCPTTFLSDAMEKNINASTVATGAAYASHPLGIASSQLFTGVVERRLGNKVMMTIGFIIAGAATVVTAFSFRVSDNHMINLFFVVFFRFLAGMGEGAADTAILNLYQLLFPDILGQVLGLSEGIIGVGFAVGPLIGGGLYSRFGWETPLLAVSAPFFVMAFVLPPFLPNDPEKAAVDDVETASQSKTKKNLQCKASTYVLTAGIFIMSATYGSISPLVTEYLDDKLNYNNLLIGGIWAVGGVIYLLAGALVGRRCDKAAAKGDYSMMTFWCGLWLGAISFLLAGPVPVVRLSPVHAAPFIIASTGFVTVSLAFVVIAGMALLTVRAPSHSAASALFNFALNLGLALGPLFCSVMKAVFDYEWAMTINTMICLAFIAVAYPTLRVLTGKRAKQTYSEIGTTN
eukprot:TRINITY_DN9486_c0_g1_i2.p1 TRINITY_DN9486_c0_g1~~TRINITY_DN9486_c0_g1_i2.p1  ORF type:complete len:469 (+),score=171.90 TRINITY_DN9486_c0_g1_i2:247-1653(+)